MILDGSTSMRVFYGMKMSGAPGVTIRTDAGQFNPMRELADGIAESVREEVSSAEPRSTWYGPPLRLGAPVGTVAAGVSPTVLMTPVEVKALARIEATRCGWTGRHSTVLFEGVLTGLIAAFSTSRTRIQCIDPALSTVLVNSPLQFSPFPLNTGRLRRTMANEWSSNGMFSGSDSSYREPVALACARLAAAVWSRVSPIAAGGLATPTGSVGGPSFVATYI